MTYELHHADCFDVVAQMHPNSVFTITDPPYGIVKVWKGGSGHGWGVARLATPQRNEWDDHPPSKVEFDNLLKVSIDAIIWGGNYFELPTSRGWLVWNKPERNFSLAEAELAWTSLDMPIRVFDCHRSDSDREHPTQKPLSLMRWCVERFTKIGDTIFDPFMGSGTTGVACIELGRNFIGCERDAGYFAIAQRRCAEASLQPALFQTDAPKSEEHLALL